MSEESNVINLDTFDEIDWMKVKVGSKEKRIKDLQGTYNFGVVIKKGKTVILRENFDGTGGDLYRGILNFFNRAPKDSKYHIYAHPLIGGDC